jgi:hypothetical protein
MIQLLDRCIMIIINYALVFQQWNSILNENKIEDLSPLYRITE